MNAKHLTAKQAWRAGWEYAGGRADTVSARQAETVLADCLIVADESTVRLFGYGAAARRRHPNVDLAGHARTEAVLHTTTSV